MRPAIIRIALLALVAGCGESGPSKTELVGTWHASNISYISTTGLGQIDIMTLGAGITLQLDADNHGVFTFTRVGGHADVMTGTWSSSIDVLTFTIAPGNEWQWDMSMSGNQLILEAGGSSWDFNADGNQEPADWRVVLAK